MSSWRGKPSSKDFFKAAKKDIVKTDCCKLTLDKFKLKVECVFLTGGDSSLLRNIAKDIGVCVSYGCAAFKCKILDLKQT